MNSNGAVTPFADCRNCDLPPLRPPHAVKREDWVAGSLFHTTTTGLRCTASLGRMGKPTGKLNCSQSPALGQPLFGLSRTTWSPDAEVRGGLTGDAHAAHEICKHYVRLLALGQYGDACLHPYLSIPTLDEALREWFGGGMELIKNKERLRKATAYPFFRLIIKWFCIVLGAVGGFYGFYLCLLAFLKRYGSLEWGILILFSMPALSFFLYAMLSMFCDIADAALMGMGREPRGRGPKIKREHPDHQNDGRNRGRRRAPRSNS
jgi:hypothetical protein